ncbi:endonuclease/exonuclease/phosphatase family protein [Rhodocaloribacter sp.]
MEPQPRKSRTLRTVLIVLILVAAVVAAYFILTYERKPAEAPPEAGAQVELVTWNLYNFGRSKDDEEMAFIAERLRDFDLIAIQEVSVSQAGERAVRRLVEALGRLGGRWDYALSDPTSGDGSERYACVWNADRLRLLGNGWLEPSLSRPIDREPFLARFEIAGRRLLLASFHAVPTSKKPAREIRLLERLHERYPDDDLVIVGDFNLSQANRAFDALKDAGFAPALVGQKTSVKMKRKAGEHLANEYDNVFYETGPLHVEEVGVIDFTEQFSTLREARRISDHLPVYVDLAWN